MEHPTIAAMAAAIREIAGAEALAIERPTVLASLCGLADHYRARVALAGAGIEFLEALAPHETIVRGLIKVGALADFPLYSTGTAVLYPGQKWLIEGVGEEVHPDECRVRLEAAGIRNSLPIRRAAIIGVEKEPWPT